MEREVQKCEYPVYKAYGMAYIKFAKDEKELFKLFGSKCIWIGFKGYFSGIFHIEIVIYFP